MLSMTNVCIIIVGARQAGLKILHLANLLRFFNALHVSSCDMIFQANR